MTLVNRKIKPATSLPPHPRHELLQVAETVAREKNIEREEVLFAMEQAILKAAKAKYGVEHDIRVSVDRHTGEIDIARAKIVVEDVEDPYTQIHLDQAKLLESESALGDEILEELPPIEFGRVTAQSARQVIIQKVRDAERAHVYEEYKDQVGEVVSGLVKRSEFGNIILDLGRGEAFLRKDETIPRENFRIGDRVRVLITEIRPDAKGPMIMVSRTHPLFMTRLFEQEVPEIYDGIIEIKSVARDPGSRAKVAVYTSDPSVDPIGSCVGIRGRRVQSIIAEFGGEKIDVIPWSENPATYVVNALAPAEVVRVILDEEANKVQVVVAESQLSLAIGRRGQNVRLASQLTGWHVDIITEEQDFERRTEDLERKSRFFMQALDLDETLAQLLSMEGFSTVEDLAYVDLEELMSVEGLDEEICKEIQNRSRNYIEARIAEIRKVCEESGMSQDLINDDSLNYIHLDKLNKAGIKTRDDLGDLSTEELLDIMDHQEMSKAEAEDLIMKIRESWFKKA